ncbi:hypothetical protein [Paenibacillus polymyxa]|uniref:hypothetical protein n=1 Tax=Paenibacillus polymyxa TaxID=1406 RepID=UPI000C9F56FD|nr:hypothetical protein [Paenibacillus polymyxa]AUS26746.1 hypothetical protein C1A50_2579 [Paenibacillus polymyxa]
MKIGEDYFNSELKERIRYWDEENLLTEADTLNEKEIYLFAKNVLKDSGEKIYCKRRALCDLLTLVYRGKVKQRRMIGLLLDEWEEIQETSLECLRLRFLSLFYQNESDDIKEILKEKSNDKNCEIVSEASYQMGLIQIFDANDTISKEDYQIKITAAESFFLAAEQNDDNRIDARILKLICRYLTDILSFKSQSADEIYVRIMTLIWETRLLSLDEYSNTVFIGISRCISKLQKIKCQNPDYWIDYRKEFNYLCVQFYELKNVEYKENLFFGKIVQNTSEKIIEYFIEPIFKFNYKASLSKIDVLLNQDSITDIEKKFLNYLKNIVISDTVTGQDTSLSYIKEIYPTINDKDIDEFIKSLHESNKTVAVLKLLESTKRYSYDVLLNSIVNACVKLQGNHLYRNVSEDDRNGFIKNILETTGFYIKDQTRWGVSNTGKSAGEVDLLIEEKNIPYSIIEALNLSSLDANYLNLHINKIFKYDTTGLPFNFIISYVKIKDFGSFWLKYKKHITEHNYPYKLETIDFRIDNEFYFSGIKIALTNHIRNGMITGLYHICVSISD